MSHTNSLTHNSQNSQRGISLLFIVLISSLILAIGLGLTALLIQEMRMMSEIGYSVTAFYAADSGIEAAIYDLYQSDPPTSVHSDESDNADLDDAGYDTLAYCCHFSFVDKCSFGDPDDPEEERPICPLGIENIGSNDPNDPDYCYTTKYCLKSTGSYQRVKRAIEIKY
jgi:hypothetical protein